MQVNLTKFFDSSAMAQKMRSMPNPETQLLQALFGGAAGTIHRNIKVSVADDVFETENIPHSMRASRPYKIDDDTVTVKELAPPPFKLEREMTASEINDIESTYRTSGLGSVQEYLADLSRRFRDKFIKSAQAMAAEYLINQGSVIFHNHEVGGGAPVTTTFDYPNKSDWNTFTPAAVWSGLTIIGIYDDLNAMAEQMLNARGIGGPYTVVVARDVYSQILGKCQSWESTGDGFRPNVTRSGIQLGEFTIQHVVGTFKNWTTAAGTSQNLITAKKVYMFGSQRRALLWCRMDAVRGNRTFIDGQMDVTPYFDERHDQWILKGQCKPFILINPASVIEATVLT